MNLLKSMARFRDTAEAHDKKNQEKAQKAEEKTKQAENKDVKKFIKLSHQMKQPDYGKSFMDKSKRVPERELGQSCHHRYCWCCMSGGSAKAHNISAAKLKRSNTLMSLV